MTICLLLVVFAVSWYLYMNSVDNYYDHDDEPQDEPEDKPKGPRKPPSWVYVGGIIDNRNKTATAFFHDFANNDDRELEMSYVDSVSGDGLEMSARAVCNRWNMEEAEALRNTGSMEAGNPPGTK